MISCPHQFRLAYNLLWNCSCLNLFWGTIASVAIYKWSQRSDLLTRADWCCCWWLFLQKPACSLQVTHARDARWPSATVVIKKYIKIKMQLQCTLKLKAGLFLSNKQLNEVMWDMRSVKPELTVLNTHLTCDLQASSESYFNASFMCRALSMRTRFRWHRPLWCVLCIICVCRLCVCYVCIYR